MEEDDHEVMAMYLHGYCLHLMAGYVRNQPREGEDWQDLEGWAHACLVACRSVRFVVATLSQLIQPFRFLGNSITWSRNIRTFKY